MTSLFQNLRIQSELVLPFIRNSMILLSFLKVPSVFGENFIVPDVCAGKFDEPPKEFVIDNEFPPQDQGAFGTCFGASAKYLIKHHYLRTKSRGDPEIDDIAFMDVLGVGTCGRFDEGGETDTVLYNVRKAGEIAYESKAEGVTYPIDYNSFYLKRRDLLNNSCLKTLQENQIVNLGTLKTIEDLVAGINSKNPGELHSRLQMHPDIKRVKIKPYNMYLMKAKEPLSFKNEILGSFLSDHPIPLELSFCPVSDGSYCSKGDHATVITRYRKACCKGKCHDQFFLNDSNLTDIGWKMADPLVDSAVRFHGKISFTKPCLEKKSSVSVDLSTSLEKCSIYPMGDNVVHTMAGAGDLDNIKRYLEDHSYNERNHLISRKGPYGRTPLLHAVLYNNLQVAQFLLEQGADVNATDYRGGSSLHYAAEKGYFEISKLLLENGSLVNQVNDEGVSPLLRAAATGQKKIVNLLLERGANAKLASKTDQTTTLLATANRHFKILKRLIKSGAPIDEPTQNGFSPLHIAAENGNKRIFNFIVKHGAKVDRTSKEGLTPLHGAAEAGQLAVVKSLIEKGSTIDQADTKGETALYKAARAGHLKVVDFLLRNGAKAESTTSKDHTPLEAAAIYGRLEVVDLLLKEGAKIRVNSIGQTIFHKAARAGKVAVVNFLIRKGIKVDHPDNSGNTPLCLAALEGELEVVKLLRQEGASLESRCELGSTPLMLAVESKNEALVSFLLSQQVLVNTIDERKLSALALAANLGNEKLEELLLSHRATIQRPEVSAYYSPLGQAIWNIHYDVAKFLISKGANVNLSDSDNMTLLCYAAEKSLKDQVEFLLKAGADANKVCKLGKTPLMIAAENNNIALVRLLASNSRRPESLSDLETSASTAVYELSLSKIEGGVSVESLSEAEKDLREIEVLKIPNLSTVKAWSELALAFLKMEYPKEAEKCFERAYELGGEVDAENIANYLLRNYSKKPIDAFQRDLERVQQIIESTKFPSHQQGTSWLKVAQVYHEQLHIDSKAISSMIRASEHGNAIALFNLYTIYSDGLLGQEPNEDKAKYYLHLAAKNGHAEAIRIIRQK